MPKALSNWDDDTFDLIEDERPRARMRARREWPWLRMLILSGAIVAGLVHLAKQEERAEPQETEQGLREIPAATLKAPAPAWAVIDRPAAIFTLDKAAPSVFEARRHSAGGRADTLTFGQPGEAGYARLTFTTNVPEPRRTLYLDLVRRAAEASLSVARNAPSETIATKFGPMEIAAITLVDRAELSCQGFRFNDEATGFGFLGWRCGSQAQPLDEAQLACFIDRITLADGSNAALKGLFAQAERNRIGLCPPGAHTAFASPAKATARP